MKRIASPTSEPVIKAIPDRAPAYPGLSWTAAEDRVSGEIVLSLEYCGRDPAAIEAMRRLLLRMSMRLEMGLTKG